MDINMKYSVNDLTQICTRILRALGASSEEAKIITNQLIEANLRGQDGHGVLLLPYYVKQVQAGLFKLGVNIDIIHETFSSTLINGNWGFGQVIATKAMEIAISKAKKHSISLVGSFNCNHIGLVASYPMMAIKQGMIGITMCNAVPQVAPYGGRARKMGTNPIAIAIPAREEYPIVLDMATSIVAAGKVRAKYVKGETTPEGWIIDGDGNPTVEPEIFLKGDRKEPGGGMLLPFGGYKGFGLSIVVDLLSGALTGAGCSSTELKRGNGLLMAAIKIESFTAIESFRKRVDMLIRSLKQTPLAPGFNEIIMPGELEFREYEQRLIEGIEIDELTWRNLESLAKELHVPMS